MLRISPWKRATNRDRPGTESDRRLSDVLSKAEDVSFRGAKLEQDWPAAASSSTEVETGPTRLVSEVDPLDCTRQSRDRPRSGFSRDSVPGQVGPQRYSNGRDIADRRPRRFRRTSWAREENVLCVFRKSRTLTAHTQYFSNQPVTLTNQGDAACRERLP
jgi:hypothetical protein